MHHLLARQLRRCGIEPDDRLQKLLALVSASYEESDRERKRQERANALLSDEVRELNVAIRIEAEARVRAILEAVSDGVVLVEEGGAVDGFNAAASTIFGLSSGEALGTSFDALWEPGYAAPSASGEGMARRADGAATEVEVTMSEALLGSRRLRIALVRDVTERKRVERSLREMKDRADAASRAKSDFLAAMSHELRTPMNGVLGMVGLLLDGNLNSNQRAYAEAIHESGEALLALLNDLLDFSKIEAGKLTLEEYDFAPAVVVESVVELLAPRALAKNIEIAVVVQPGVPLSAVGDAGRLRQILMNLIANAVKFTETGGVIVELQAHEITEEAFVLRVDVVDSGIGIRPEVVPNLFAEFVQADASTTRRFGGTGLGLAICRRLCGLMSGSIGVDSTEGKGSRFWFTIPLKTPFVQQMPSNELAGLRCLVVDDTPLNREIFERQLMPWGAEVVTTASADGALAELVKAIAIGRSFDVVIVDQHMPAMSGKELGAIVRAMPTLSSTRLVLATSGLNEESATDFDHVFTKPLRPSALLRALAQIRTPERAAAPKPAPPPPLQPNDARRLRILVVEDNAINQKVATGYLEKAGHRVDVASNGVEALAAVRGLPYDLVLMDVQMPEMDGLTATRAIRGLGGDRGSVPIIGLTANAMQGDREACLGAGMNDYLAKPVDRTRLLEKIGRWTAPRAAPNSRPPELGDKLARPSFDTATFQMLEDDLGVADFVSVLESFQRTLAELGDKLARFDLRELRAEAHKLRGGAGALGVTPVATAAEELERALVAGVDHAPAMRRLVSIANAAEKDISQRIAIRRAA